jgi:hypothetical protein
MSLADFSPAIQVQTNPSLKLSNVGTSASGTSTNGSNQTTGTVNAFWFAFVMMLWLDSFILILIQQVQVM